DVAREFMIRCSASSSFFFSTPTTTTYSYTLSLHDALPIFLSQRVRKVAPPHPNGRQDARHSNGSRLLPAIHRSPAGRTMDGRKRSEEHTSELQSLAYLVCRLLLEKKKKKKKTIKRTLVSAL